MRTFVQLPLGVGADCKVPVKADNIRSAAPGDRQCWCGTKHDRAQANVVHQMVVSIASGSSPPVALFASLRLKSPGTFEITVIPTAITRTIKANLKKCLDTAQGK